MRRLEVLAEAVTLGSLTAAASKLELTPGAASQAIKALETQTGVDLLERLPRGVRPTEAGERLAAHAFAVLTLLAEAEAELAGERPQTLTIAAFPTAVFGLVPDLLYLAAERYPELRVEILELEPEAARVALREGRCQAALVNHHSLLAPDAQGPWSVTHLRDEKVYAALSLDHPLAGRTFLRAEELGDDSWITQQPASPCQELLLRVCSDAGFAAKVSGTCGDYRSILGLVSAGHGVSLIPELALVGLEEPDTALIPLRPRVFRRINALVSSRAAAAPAARAVLSLLDDGGDL